MLNKTPEKSRSWLVFTLVAGALCLSACETTNTATLAGDAIQSDGETATQALTDIERSIAIDIVQITQQIFPAFSTTLQFTSNQNDALLQHFAQSFASLGYGVQRVSADQGAHHFSYTLNDKASGTDRRVVQFQASVGGIRITRDYQYPSSNTISPASPVRIAGTRKPVDVPDIPTSTFRITNDYFTRVVYEASLNLDEQAPPLISLITDNVVSGVASNSANRNSNAPSFSGINSSRVETSNLFHTRESNFGSILENRERIVQQFIVFGNDSLVLGNTNKLLLEQMVKQKLQSNDVINLIGCSTGYTALDIGNEGLALGRAKRVTEALLSQGIARERILDEGCWAPEAGSTDLPNRGVMLEIWRQNT